MLSQCLDGMVGRASLNQPKERKKQSTSLTLVLSALHSHSKSLGKWVCAWWQGFVSFTSVLHSHSKSLANGCALGGKAYFAYLTSAVDSDSSTSLGCCIEFLLKNFFT